MPIIIIVRVSENAWKGHRVQTYNIIASPMNKYRYKSITMLPKFQYTHTPPATRASHLHTQRLHPLPHRPLIHTQRDLRKHHPLLARRHVRLEPQLQRQQLQPLPVLLP